MLGRLTKVRRTANLSCEKETLRLPSALCTAVGLSPRLPYLTRFEVWFLRWCSTVCSCVVSLLRLKGPFRQLLVLVLRLDISLCIRLCVARSRTGIRDFVFCNLVSRLRFELLGNTTLRIMFVKLLLLSVVWVLVRALMALIANFDKFKLMLRLLERIGLLLITSKCTVRPSCGLRLLCPC